EHSPIVCLLFVPFGLFPYSIAGQVWYWLNVCFIAIIAIVLAQHYITARSTVLGSGLVMLSLVGFTPLRLTLGLGQLDILILLLTILAIVLAGNGISDDKRKSSELLAGVLLAVAGGLKYYPLGFLAFYIWKRHYRPVLSACGALIVLVLLSICI